MSKKPSQGRMRGQYWAPSMRFVQQVSICDVTDIHRINLRCSKFPFQKSIDKDKSWGTECCRVETCRLTRFTRQQRVAEQQRNQQDQRRLYQHRPQTVKTIPVRKYGITHAANLIMYIPRAYCFSDSAYPIWHTACRIPNTVNY